MFQVESCFVKRINDSRSADSVESIDYQYSFPFAFGLISREYLGREAFTTPIYGSYFKGINESWLYFDGMGRLAD